MPRLLLVEMAALALLSPTGALAQAAAGGCHATPQEPRKEVPWAGNAGEIQWSADQLDCKVDSAGMKWLTVSVLPPVSNDPAKRVLRYSVDTNFAPAKREGKIQIGDASVVIDQAPGPPPGMAFSPARLEFEFAAGAGLLEASKRLYVGSEEPLVFTAVPDKTSPWIRVKTDGDGPREQRAFEVTVSALGKEPGVYKGDIVLESPGAANPKELVPVTMTVGK